MFTLCVFNVVIVIAFSVDFLLLLKSLKYSNDAVLFNAKLSSFIVSKKYTLCRKVFFFFRYVEMEKMAPNCALYLIVCRYIVINGIITDETQMSLWSWSVSCKYNISQCFDDVVKPLHAVSGWVSNWKVTLIDQGL